MDFTALQTETFARGLEYLNDAGAGLTRVKRWINDSMHEINLAAEWPFLETSTTGAPPVTPTALRKVKSVHDATNRTPLQATTREWIVSTFGNVTDTTGVGRFYYVENGVVRAYPVTSATLTVYYYKNGTDLSAGADTPDMPTRFHEIIVDGAVVRAYKDNDDYAQAQALEQSRLQQVEAMKRYLLTETLLPIIGEQAVQGVPQEQPAQ